MSQQNIRTADFFEGIPQSAPVRNDKELLEAFTDISDMMSEALIMLDFQKRNFLYVSSHYLFLGGYTPEMVKREGYEFFKRMLHPEDLPLWRDIHVILLKSLYYHQLPTERIHFFGCTLRIRSFLSDEDKKPDYLMAYLKIKPLFLQNLPCMGICLLSVSVVPNSGNLCVYYNNCDYSTYSFISGKWSFHPFAPLSKREKQILVWCQEGLSNNEMADKLNLTVKVVEKVKTSLFEEQSLFDELNLNSFPKKLQYANNRCLIYQSPALESNRQGRRKYPPRKCNKIFIISILHAIVKSNAKCRIIKKTE